MFTGIIETIGVLAEIVPEGGNVHLKIQSDLTSELKIDQSISHNGVCLTVVAIEDSEYVVTAIEETLQKSALGHLQPGDQINLERAMKIGDRLDGHIVQGHVDQTGECLSVDSKDGSWIFTFKYDPSLDNITIEKGSITVNGVSLTVVDSRQDRFSVAIIPYTFENTNFHTLKPGSKVNLEFDVVGKYVKRIMSV